VRTWTRHRNFCRARGITRLLAGFGHHCRGHRSGLLQWPSLGLCSGELDPDGDRRSRLCSALRVLAPRGPDTLRGLRRRARHASFWPASATGNWPEKSDCRTPPICPGFCREKRRRFTASARFPARSICPRQIPMQASSPGWLPAGGRRFARTISNRFISSRRISPARERRPADLPARTGACSLTRFRT